MDGDEVVVPFSTMYGSLLLWGSKTFAEVIFVSGGDDIKSFTDSFKGDNASTVIARIRPVNIVPMPLNIAIDVLVSTRIKYS